MPGKVIRFADHERKSREADAQFDGRDPSEISVVIILPVIRIERPKPSAKRKRKSR